MAKSDIISAFRLIPVSPNDYPRLGFTYKNMYYYDKCLAGCASSCQIFECFYTALEWILRNKFSVKHCIHVLDEFMFLGASFEECKKYLESWEHLCNMLNVSLAVKKTIGPAQEIVFLGIQLSSREMTARLPQEKISLYTNKLSNLMSKLVQCRSSCRYFSNTTMEKLCFYQPKNILRCHSTCSRMQVKWHVLPLLAKNGSSLSFRMIGKQKI